jgi:hypothetical protein
MRGLQIVFHETGSVTHKKLLVGLAFVPKKSSHETSWSFPLHDDHL